MDSNSNHGPRRNEELDIIAGSSSSSSSLDRALVNQDDIESQCPSSRSHCNNVLLPFQDTASYRKRVKSYSPLLYFAKPLLLSPLVCARFGWYCTGKDIIQCVECKSAIAVIFHPDLSPESYSKLALTYRQMLATSHKTTCCFATDAARWLLMNSNGDSGRVSGRVSRKEKIPDNLDDVQPFTVPPYLIPMAKGFQVMEDCTESGFLTREYLRDEALAIARYCIDDCEIDPRSLQVPISSELMSRINLICGMEATTRHLVVDVDSDDNDNKIEDHDDQVTLSLLHDLCMMMMKKKKNQDQPQPQQDKELQQPVQVTKEVMLLALFGWSIRKDMNHVNMFGQPPETPGKSSQQQQQQQQQQQPSSSSLPLSSQEKEKPSKTSLIVVSCPLCLCECSIACSSSLSKSWASKHNDKLQHATTVVNTEEHHAKKRRLVGDGFFGCDAHGSTSSTSSDKYTGDQPYPPPLLSDLVQSHRHFCPMSNGFMNYKDKYVIEDDMIFNIHTSTTRPGWEIYLMSLCRGKQRTQNDDHGHGVNLLDKIRKALRSNSLQHNESRLKDYGNYEYNATN
eukprot:CAMPEP_0176492260 /NCGR_PEP_ID=MMETSP0200_2-20121128/8891_1 /TAXON_ID=947934 /ORGANISM="Chaetoceros sp., Strain GSL56" /LENGTH=565 /DNA_ID=CAMNT_0017889785 /DNA_START=95 /DNA_END=1792 /DNA_ORIENTATION=+